MAGRTKTVQWSRSGPVLHVFLDRPERLNAVNADLVEDLVEALAVSPDSDVHAVVLAGHGRSFCAGHDLKEDLSGESSAVALRRLERLQDVTRAIRALDVPVVAAVHGHAIGAGAEIVLACDLVVAGSGTVLRFPEASLGLSVTNGATRLLPAMVGPLRAKRLVLLGEQLEAEAAHELGLVSQVVPAVEVLEHARRWADQLAALDPGALRAAKHALNAGMDSTITAAMDLEVRQALASSGHGDPHAR